MKIRYERITDNNTWCFVNLGRNCKGGVCSIRRDPSGCWRIRSMAAQGTGLVYRKFVRRCEAKRFVEANIANLIPGWIMVNWRRRKGMK